MSLISDLAAACILVQGIQICGRLWLRPVSCLQGQRRAIDSSSAEAVDAFLVKLDACIAADQEFSLILDDPAGKLPTLYLGFCLGYEHPETPEPS